MIYNILAISNFKKEFKKLAKKYPSLKVDLSKLIEELEVNPSLGTLIEKNCHKI
jgi:mRNA-degrading endonuclease YafQ of YafQ-DinJ toxin-antitoxin module